MTPSYSRIVVSNSTLAFVNLFDDQGLEQKIKEVKKYGALPGITQDEETFDRFVATAPRLSSMVEEFLTTYPKVQNLSRRKSTISSRETWAYDAP